MDFNTNFGKKVDRQITLDVQQGKVLRLQNSEEEKRKRKIVDLAFFNQNFGYDQKRYSG